MCPEPGLISAFVDDEVPSPWKERLAAHLESCPACAAKASSYRSLRESLAGPCDGLDEAAVLGRLESRLGARLDSRLAAPASPASASEPAMQPSAESHRGLWSKRLPVPMPLAAAAAAVFVFLAGLAFSGLIHPATSPVQTLATNQLAPNPSQASSMEALISYLETQDATVNLTIQLPSGATLDSSGKPLVVRAADVNYQGDVGMSGK